MRLNPEEISRLNIINANYYQIPITSVIRQRSQSFTNFDNIENSMLKSVTPPPRKDVGVMCGVLTRNVGVGHQNPNARSVSTATSDSEISDRWLGEKVKFLNDIKSTIKTVTRTRETQTILQRSGREVGIQTKIEPPRRTNASQTLEMSRSVHHIGVSAIAKCSDKSTQKRVEWSSVGSSDDTVNSIICEKCQAPKKSVALGPDTILESHTAPVSLASLNSRSKSFNLGPDSLDFKRNRTRTVGLQYEINSMSRSCQAEIRVKSLTKSCQSELKMAEKSSQCERKSTSKQTDTLDLTCLKKYIASEAKEVKVGTNDSGCNTDADFSACSKFERDREEAKEVVKKDGGSPTPSRIPRLQIPTAPVENRKFRRQDTYTKIYSPPSEKTSPILSLSR